MSGTVSGATVHELGHAASESTAASEASGASAPSEVLPASDASAVGAASEASDVAPASGVPDSATTELESVSDVSPPAESADIVPSFAEPSPCPGGGLEPPDPQ